LLQEPALLDLNDLSALVGSRICHDLISPIGAIGNGVELIAMDARSDGPEMAMISESVQSANARICFFRIAFGATIADSQISIKEVSAILTDLARTGRHNYKIPDEGAIPRADAKLIFLSIMCLETAFPYGAMISLTQTQNRWQIKAEGEKIQIVTELWDLLVQENPAWRSILPAHVQFLLVPAEAHRQHRRLSTHVGASHISFSF
jgi:histidine phosphotransferase ChpT